MEIKAGRDTVFVFNIETQNPINPNKGDQMKLTQDGKTLFQALCALFTDKAGHALSKRGFGEKTQLIASRDKDGKILKINLVFLTHNILTIQDEQNRVYVDVTGWFTQAAINRLNKVLTYVDMNIRKVNDQWVIADKSGQQAQFHNADYVDLTRPHGSAIYPQREEVAPQA